MWTESAGYDRYRNRRVPALEDTIWGLTHTAPGEVKRDAMSGRMVNDLNRLINVTEGSDYRNLDQSNSGNVWVTTTSTGWTPPSFTPRTSAWYDSKNQMVNAGLGIHHDPAGNQDMIGGYTFSFDAENRLTSSTISGATTTYAYDAEGRRVKKGSTVFAYDASGKLAAEYGGANPATGTQYLTADHLGSTRLITNAPGVVQQCRDYLPFGEELPQGAGGRPECYAAANEPAQKFTGKERDQETGLDYFGARYFAGAQGRFTSADAPLADQHPRNPQTWNLYSYARNNPLRFVDETGQASVEYLRRKAVRLAWEQERSLVRRTGQGTRDWNAAEMQELLSKGKVSGYKGHHINNVASAPGLAGDPNNIDFVDQAEHMERHNGGRTRLPTRGGLMMRGLAILDILQVAIGAMVEVRETQITGVSESMSPFSFGQTFIVDPTQAAITLEGAYIEVSGEHAGIYQVQNGTYTRTGCTDKPEKCTVDPKKLKGARFEIVDYQ